MENIEEKVENTERRISQTLLSRAGKRAGPWTHLGLQCSVVGITPLCFFLYSAPGGRASILLSVTFCCYWLTQGDNTADGNIWRVTVLRNWTSLSSNRFMLTCVPISTKKRNLLAEFRLYWDKERQCGVLFPLPSPGQSCSSSRGCTAEKRRLLQLSLLRHKQSSQINVSHNQMRYLPAQCAFPQFSE